MAARAPGSYNWPTLILLPIIGVGVLVGIIFTTSLVGSLAYQIFAFIASLIIVMIFIYGVAATATKATTTSAVPPAVAASRDAFTYDPGETSTGVVVFDGNAAALPDQYTCKLKSSHTVYEDGQCNCMTGYYGRMCEFQGFDDGYVSLTTSTPATALTAPSQPAATLSSWPVSSTVTGCTNICTANPACVGVTYANGVCTQYISLSFSQAPIQTDIDPPVLDTTLYLNKSRLLSVNFKGYFNIVFGVLPVRYFVGNGITSGTGTNVHVTASGSRIGYYPIGVQSTFSGIPDWIVVGTPGTLYISPNKLPAPSAITPGMGTLVALAAPLILPKDRFPYGKADASYWVRLDGP